MLFLINSVGEATPTEKFDFQGTPGLSVALGCFDGVHKGHQALMDKAASKEGLLPAVWTFSEPISKPFIDNVSDRVSIFGKHGARLAICEEFMLVKTFTPEDFVRHMVEDFNVKHFVCGEDFRFGINRSGGADTLKVDAEAYGATVDIIPPLMTEGEKISSTLIRKLLIAGEIERANELLCRPFSVTEKVVKGRQIGRQMSFPTVNQRMEEGRVILKHGVYDTVTLVDGKRYPSVTNIGYRPTVNENENDITYETHIIGESLYLYGKTVTVEFHRFAREERKFSSLEELKETVAEDIKKTVEFFGLK